MCFSRLAPDNCSIVAASGALQQVGATVVGVDLRQVRVHMDEVALQHGSQMRVLCEVVSTQETRF